MKRIYLLVAIIMIGAGTVTAQVQPKPKPKATPKPATIITSATTDEGKRVVLKSDGTWEFDTQSVAPAPKSTPTPEPVVPKDKFAPKVRVAAEAALKTLRRMGSAVEVGLTLSEYNSRLIDLKADIDEHLSQIPDGDLRTSIQLAVESYVDAQNAWKEMGRHDTLFPTLEPGRSLMAKYSIPIDRSIGMELLPGRSVRNIIWLTAKSHVEKAGQIFNS